MTLEELQENFLILDDWEDRYRYLIELGKTLPTLEDQYKTEENRIQGCLSKVWMIYHFENDRLQLKADSDTLIVKGLVFLILTIYQNQTKAHLNQIDINAIFKQFELEKHLTANRRNGFFSMVEKIRQLSLT
jgi:cysteine desulfuration protein SufE